MYEDIEGKSVLITGGSTQGLTIKGYVCDVSIAQQVKETIALCAEQHGGLAVLCCNVE
ncbi:hypothetical protein [Gibbsiella quercinecans]|uniref:hypothetical protein n=1 Tax=Gibbsiella quercinecans TaxID=929813 RepID=UPI0015FEF992|nr:hypothetical protein [Gibbsiella quercinecans]